MIFWGGGGEEYMKLGGGGTYTIWSRQEGGRVENKARNEMPVLGSFKFNCLVPYRSRKIGYRESTCKENRISLDPNRVFTC